MPPRKKVLLTTHYGAGGGRNFPSALGYLPYFADLPDFSQFFYVPTPAFGLRFIQETVAHPIDVLEYPTPDEYESSLDEGYDVVGMTFMTFKSHEAIEMARIAREHGVSEIWAGGYGVDTPAGLGNHFDRIFRGHSESEVSLALTGKPAPFKKHPTFVVDATVGFYDFKLGYLITSMGCDAGCRFCHATTYMPRRLEVPLDEIRKALDRYAELGVPGVLIFDDNFSVRSEHSRRVIEMLSERDMVFWFECRADDIHGMVGELVEKGLFGICMGIESLRESDLEQSNKRESVRQILDVIEELRANDVWFMTTYMFGWEDDSPESIESDLEKISSLDIPFFQSMIMTPFPGTIIWRDWEPRITDRTWSHYDHQHLVFDHPNLTPDEANEALVRCYDLFTGEVAISTLTAWENKFGALVS